MKILSNLDLTTNQLLNAKIQSLASDPSTSGNGGLIWYNSTTNLLKVSNGTSADTLTNILEAVTGSGAIQVSAVSGKAQTISVVPATASVPGTMSASDFTKLGASTAANTASAIVQRDSSGNFVAGTITAALTGTASNATQLNNQAASFYLNFANTTGQRTATSAISDFDTQVRTSRLDQFAVPTAAVAFNAQRITGLADPTSPQDAATKGYVDGMSAGLDIKASVRVATTANLSAITYTATAGTSGRGQITGAPSSLDSVALTAGNRVLVKDQTTGAQNGIYVVTTLGTGANGVWDRALDFDSDADVTAGAFTFVEEGATYDNIGFVLTTNNPITLGGSSGTSLAFTQFSSAGSYTAGSGLALNANQFSVLGTAGRITVSGSGVDIASTYVGQSTITTLGTVTTGTWNATTIGLGFGGTGATTAAGARSNLGAVGKFAQTLSTSATSYTVTHNLNSQDVTVVLRDATSNAIALVDAVATDTNNVTLNFTTAQSANAWKVVVFG